MPWTNLRYKVYTAIYIFVWNISWNQIFTKKSKQAWQSGVFRAVNEIFRRSFLWVMLLLFELLRSAFQIFLTQIDIGQAGKGSVMIHRACFLYEQDSHRSRLDSTLHLIIFRKNNWCASVCCSLDHQTGQLWRKIWIVSIIGLYTTTVWGWLIFIFTDVAGRAHFFYCFLVMPLVLMSHLRLYLMIG